MRNIVLAAAAAFALVLSVAPTFAAQANGNHEQAARSESSSVDNQCANIRANPAGYPASDVRACQMKY